MARKSKRRPKLVCRLVIGVNPKTGRIVVARVPKGCARVVAKALHLRRKKIRVIKVGRVGRRRRRR